MEAMTSNGKWFDDRRFVLTVLTLAAAFLINAAMTIWITSGWFSRMDSRVTEIEKTTTRMMPLEMDFARVKAFQETVLPRLTRIEEKVDRVVEVLNRQADAKP